MRKRGVFGDAAVGIVGRGIVADANQLDALQAEHAPGFRPAAIIADHHAHDRVVPVRSGAEGGKSEVAIFEIALFELLVGAPARGSTEPGKMHLAIAAENFAVAIDQDRTIEAPTVRRQFGITDIEADAAARGRDRTRAARPDSACRARSNGRARRPRCSQRGKKVVNASSGNTTSAGAARGRLLQQRQHPAKRMLARIRFLRRPHLSGGGAKNTNQHCLQSVRIAALKGG